MRDEVDDDTEVIGHISSKSFSLPHLKHRPMCVHLCLRQIQLDNLGSSAELMAKNKGLGLNSSGIDVGSEIVLDA